MINSDLIGIMILSESNPNFYAEASLLNAGESTLLGLGESVYLVYLTSRDVPFH